MCETYTKIAVHLTSDFT